MEDLLNLAMRMLSSEQLGRVAVLSALSCLFCVLSLAAPIQIDTFESLQIGVANCQEACMFQFNQPVVQVSVQGMLEIQGLSVSILGMRGGTTVKCSNEASRGSPVITVTGNTTAAFNTSLSLQDLTVTNCQDMVYFLLSSDASISLTNVNFTSNAPRKSLLQLNMSARAQQTLTLSRVTLMGNHLTAGASLLNVRNQDIDPQSPTHPGMQAIQQVIRQTVCGPSGDLKEVPLLSDTINNALQPDLVNTIMDTAFQGWLNANQLLDDGELSNWLVPVRIDQLQVLQTTATTSATEASINPIPISINGSNVAHITAQPWINSIQYDFLHFSGVNFTATSITFDANSFKPEKPGQYTCRSLLHLSASATRISNMTAQRNSLVTAMRVESAVGTTVLGSTLLSENIVEGCPLVRFEGSSVMLNDAGGKEGPGARRAGCGGVPSLAQMEKLYWFWQQMALIKNEYGSPSGDVQAIGMIKLQGDLDKTSDEVRDLCFEARNISGLPTDLFNTYESMVNNKFLAYLEHGVIQKALHFSRDAPLLVQDVAFDSNTAQQASLFHIAGTYKPGTYGATFLDIKNTTFTGNTLQSINSTPTWQSLLNIEQAFGKIQDAHFTNNTNSSAIIVDKSALQVLRVQVIGNSALSTPLLYVGNITGEPTIHKTYIHLMNVTVSHNNASGPVFIVFNSKSQFQQVTLDGNRADVDSSVWSQGVPDLPTQANGVLYVFDTAWQRFVDVAVDNNMASLSMLTFNTTYCTMVKRLRCEYNNGTCLHIVSTSGKDLNLDGDSSSLEDFFSIAGSSFVGNVGSGKYAAGLQLTNGDWLKFHIYDCNFTNNVGKDGPDGTYGAALSNVPDYTFGREKKAALLRLHGLNFTGNRAFAGGAMFGERTAFTMWNSSFQDNSATRIGGAIYCKPCQWDYLFNSTFQSNTAPQGGAIVVLTDHYHWILTSGQQVMILAANRFINNVASGKRTDPYNADWEVCPSGGGGALCAVVVYDAGGFVNAYVQGNEFVNNTATWGGAALVNGWVPVGSSPMCFITFSNNTIINNTVIDGAGPILFYNASGNICLDCQNTDPAPLRLEFGTTTPGRSTKSDSKAQFLLRGFTQPVGLPAPTSLNATLTSCSESNIDSWRDNKVIRAASYSKGDLATYPTKMRAHLCNDDKSDCSAVSMTGRSGANFHVNVTLFDADGLVVPNSPTNITVVVSKADGVGTGLLVYNWRAMELSGSNRLFEDVAFQTLQDPNGTMYDLTFYPLTSQGFMEPVTLNLTVRSCTLGEYLGAMHTCTICDKGSFTLMHRLPCLPCISGAHCYSEVGNTTLGQGLLVPQPGFWKSSPYSPIVNRCPLSGSCKVSSTGANTNRTRTLLGLLSNKTFPLSTAEKDAFMARQCSTGFKGRLCGSCDQEHGRTGNRCIRCIGIIANTVLLALALLFLCLFVAALSYNHAKAVLQHTLQARLEARQLVVQNHGDTLVSIVKVFVSYLQVLAIMKSVPITWPPALLRFVSFVDITSAPEWVAIDCSLPRTDAQTKAIVRTTTAMFLPVLLMMVAALYWWGWSRVGSRQRRLQSSGISWTDFLVLTTIQICFTLYTFSTGATMNMFASTTVDKLQGDNTMMKLYSAEFPDLEPQHYWTQNYEHRFVTGSHAIVAFVFGLPWLVLFSLGFPVLSACLLQSHKQHLMAPRIMLKYGFLYQEYKEDFFSWESVVMLRKVSLLAVAIFLQPAGTMMQLTTASLLMYMSILLHELFRPYRANLVNGMERVSLFANMANVSCLTFIAAGSTNHLRITMTAFIFIINLSVISYFLYLVFHVGLLWFHEGGLLTRAVHHVASTFSKVNKSMAGKGSRGRGDRHESAPHTNDISDQGISLQAASPSSFGMASPVVHTHSVSTGSRALFTSGSDNSAPASSCHVMVPEPPTDRHTQRAVSLRLPLPPERNVETADSDPGYGDSYGECYRDL